VPTRAARSSCRFLQGFSGENSGEAAGDDRATPVILKRARSISRPQAVKMMNDE
jgi:hypothetical protein